MRILVTGSRHFGDCVDAWQVIKDALINHGAAGTTLVHGGAHGADSMAAYTWSEMGLPVEEHLADWKKYNKRAGYLRNEKMVTLGADIVLAFKTDDPNDNKGTQHTIDLATKKGISVVEFVAHKLTPVELLARKSSTDAFDIPATVPFEV